MSNRRQFLLGAAAVAAPSFIRPARAAVVNLRVAHNNVANTSSHAATLAFQKHMVEHGSGLFDVEVYPYSMLGNEAQVSRAVAEGTLDAYVAPNSILGKFSDDIPLLEFPFLFDDLKHARASLDGKLGAALAEKLEKKGLLVVGWAENGLRHTTANKPIRTPDDFKGVKLRVQLIKIHVEVFKGFGALAGPLAWTELPSSMRTGQFDAQENPVASIAANDFLSALQTHLSMTGHVYSPFPIVFSKNTWERLPAAKRTLVREAGIVAAEASRRFNDEAEGPALEKLRRAGMTIVTDVDVPAFKRAVEKMAPEMAKHHDANALSAMRKLIG